MGNENELYELLSKIVNMAESEEVKSCQDVINIFENEFQFNKA
ncbi:hypothetical protein [Thalassobacillus hwangdonensis]|uniref:Uncharacterized protein n=1 Tax=Thalassobacillus hwangdonensis TaxID=546108 RepID=A0ABW3L458_9BACI